MGWCRSSPAWLGEKNTFEHVESNDEKKNDIENYSHSEESEDDDSISDHEEGDLMLSLTERLRKLWKVMESYRRESLTISQIAQR